MQHPPLGTGGKTDSCNHISLAPVGLGNVNASCKGVPHLPSRQPFKKTKRETILPPFCLGQGSCRVLTLEHAREFRQLKASSRSYYVRNPTESPNPNKFPQKGQCHPVLTPRLTGGHEPGNYHLASTKAFSPKGRGLPSPMPSGSGSPPFSAPASMPYPRAAFPAPRQLVPPGQL